MFGGSELLCDNFNPVILNSVKDYAESSETNEAKKQNDMSSKFVRSKGGTEDLEESKHETRDESETLQIENNQIQRYAAMHSAEFEDLKNCYKFSSNLENESIRCSLHNDHDGNIRSEKSCHMSKVIVQLREEITAERCQNRNITDRLRLLESKLAEDRKAYEDKLTALNVDNSVLQIENKSFVEQLAVLNKTNSDPEKSKENTMIDNVVNSGLGILQQTPKHRDTDASSKGKGSHNHTQSPEISKIKGTFDAATQEARQRLSSLRKRSQEFAKQDQPYETIDFNQKKCLTSIQPRKTFFNRTDKRKDECTTQVDQSSFLETNIKQSNKAEYSSKKKSYLRGVVTEIKKRVHHSQERSKDLSQAHARLEDAIAGFQNDEFSTQKPRRLFTKDPISSFSSLEKPSYEQDKRDSFVGNQCFSKLSSARNCSNSSVKIRSFRQDQGLTFKELKEQLSKCKAELELFKKDTTSWKKSSDSQNVELIHSLRQKIVDFVCPLPNSVDKACFTKTNKIEIEGSGDFSKQKLLNDKCCHIYRELVGLKVCQKVLMKTNVNLEKSNKELRSENLRLCNIVQEVRTIFRQSSSKFEEELRQKKLEIKELRLENSKIKSNSEDIHLSTIKLLQKDILSYVGKLERLRNELATANNDICQLESLNDAMSSFAQEYSKERFEELEKTLIEIHQQAEIYKDDIVILREKRKDSTCNKIKKLMEARQSIKKLEGELEQIKNQNCGGETERKSLVLKLKEIKLQHAYVSLENKKLKSESLRDKNYLASKISNETLFAEKIVKCRDELETAHVEIKALKREVQYVQRTRKSLTSEMTKLTDDNNKLHKLLRLEIENCRIY
mmetsp:Transcript_33352/g.38642  ORF Transcript_33352/g.38642 Transcript_33352/m.38642 type:complete len:843 (-) Transcript_33352:9-2537(-)